MEQETKNVFQRYDEFQEKSKALNRRKRTKETFNPEKFAEIINRVKESIIAVTENFPEDDLDEFFEMGEYNNLIILFNDKKEGEVKVYLGNEEIYLGCYSYNPCAEYELESYLANVYPGFDKIYQYEFYLDSKTISFNLKFKANLRGAYFGVTELGYPVLKSEYENKSIKNTLKSFNQDISKFLGYEVMFSDENVDLANPCWLEFALYTYDVEKNENFRTYEYQYADFHLVIPIE